MDLTDSYRLRESALAYTLTGGTRAQNFIWKTTWMGVRSVAPVPAGSTSVCTMKSAPALVRSRFAEATLVPTRDRGPSAMRLDTRFADWGADTRKVPSLHVGS